MNNKKWLSQKLASRLSRNLWPRQPRVSQQRPAESTPVPQEPPAEPVKKGRGRPAGSKDKAPRQVKPKIKVEPLPAPVAPAQPASSSAAPVAQEPSQEPAASAATELAPPSPQTLYRQTAAQLLNLRDAMNSQKRTAAASQYASRLHAWPGL